MSISSDFLFIFISTFITSMVCHNLGLSLIRWHVFGCNSLPFYSNADLCCDIETTRDDIYFALLTLRSDNSMFIIIVSLANENRLAAAMQFSVQFLLTDLDCHLKSSCDVTY